MTIHMKGQITRCGYEWTMTKIQLLEDENLALKTSVPRDDSSARPWELAQRVWRDFKNQAEKRRKERKRNASTAEAAEAVPPGTRVFYEQSTGMNRECLIYAVRHDGSVCLLPVDLEI